MKTSRLIIAAVAALIVIGGLTWIYHHTHVSSGFNFKATPHVKLGSVKAITIPNIATTTGSVVTLQAADISPKVDGYVTKIYYHEGEHVKAGQILIQLDNNIEKEALNADMIKAKMSKLQFDRDNKLLKRGFILQDTQYNQKVTNQEDRAKIEEDTTNLNNKTIRAPFSGIVGAKTISVGDFIQAGKSIVTLTNTDDLIAQYYLPSRFINKISLGQTVIIQSGLNAKIADSGKVSYIAPNINADSQTIEIHAKINNSKQQLKPGEYVKITQILGNPQRALVVPASSVLASLQGFYVYQVKNHKAVKVPVTVGNHYHNVVAITKGLKLNDNIVIVGQDELRNGEKVTE